MNIVIGSLIKPPLFTEIPVAFEWQVADYNTLDFGSAYLGSFPCFCPTNVEKEQQEGGNIAEFAEKNLRIFTIFS